jgi:hypothetical protein
MREFETSMKGIKRGQSGQIVVEYVLMLIIGVGLAMLITSTMVSRNPDDPGFLVQKWLLILQTIGEDTADDLKPPSPEAAS